MPELRKDFLLERWAVISPERAHRPMPPADPAAQDDENLCPFCPGHEAETPPEILALGRPGGAPDTPGWTARVFPNKYPALLPGGGGVLPSGDGDRLPGEGRHEVVVETPEHRVRMATFSDDQMGTVMEAVHRRHAALATDPGVRAVLAFRNEGRAAGATQSHPHLQILGFPRVPPLLAEELTASREAYRSGGDCPWCRLLAAELGSGERVIEAGAEAVILAPRAPRVPYELWVLPRRHRARFDLAAPGERVAVGLALRSAARRLERVLGPTASNWFLHGAGPGDGAEAYFHWHVELVPRTAHAAGFEWGSGLFLHPVLPESAARALRDAIG